MKSEGDIPKNSHFYVVDVCRSDHMGDFRELCRMNLFAPAATDFAFETFSESYLCPPFGQSSFRVDFRILMSREAQVDEPFLVESLSRFLQKLDLLAVVVDKGIKGAQPGNNLSLLIQGWRWYFKGGDHILCYCVS